MKIFKNKGVVRLYAFITACLIVITIIASCSDAFAESNNVSIASFYNFNLSSMGYTSNWNLSDYQSSSLYNENFSSISWSTVSVNNEFYKLLNGDTSDGELCLPSSFTYEGQTYNLSDFPYFSICDNGGGAYFVYLMKKVDFDVVFTRSMRYSLDSNLSNDYAFRFTCLTDGTAFELTRCNRGTISDSDVPIYSNPSNDSRMYICNYPVSAIDLSKIDVQREQVSAGYLQYYMALMQVGGYGVSSWGEDYIIENINYFLTDYRNPITNEDYSGSVGNVSGEQWDNFQYLTGQSGIYFQCTNCNNGLVQFVAQYPNSLQNPENYSIKITGSCTYDFTLNGDSFALTDLSSILRKYNGFSSTGGSRYNITGTLNDPFIYYQSKLDSLGNTPLNFSLNGTGTTSYLNKNINDNMKTSSGASITSLAEYFTQKKVAEWQSVANNIASVVTNKILGNEVASVKTMNSDDVTLNAITYTFTMTLYERQTDEDVISDGDTNLGSITRTYNMLSGTASEPTDTLSVDNSTVSSNTEPGTDYYNHSTDFNTNYDDDSSSGGGSGSGGGSVSGDNNIVINNNPTFNNNGGGSSGGGSNTESDASLLSFFDTFNPFKTIFNKLSGNNEVIADDTAETIGANRFITVISNTFGFIPTEIWTTLAWFLGASLAILIVAVVLRIILDLL